MTYTLDIPNINTLDPKDPSYVAKLDAGMTKITESAVALIQEMHGIVRNGKNIGDYLKANGITDIQPEVFFDEEIKTQSGQANAFVIGIKIPKDKEKARQLEDVVQKYDRKIVDEQDAWEENRKNLRRAFEDYTGAIKELTQVEPLGTSKTEHNDLHLFIVRPDGVYEFHQRMDKPYARNVQKNPHLEPALFDTPNYIDDFAKQAVGISANAYVVRNPSTTIPIEDLTYEAVLKVSEQLAKQEMAETKKAEDQKGPGQKLVDRIKKAMRL
jgi:hypothetical protein